MERMTYDFSNITKGITVKRFPGSPRMPKESTLFRHICRLLNDAGFDVVRQVPDKDGHMFGAPYYIRDQKRRWCLYDTDYAIRDMAKAFNEGIEIKLYYFDMEK